MMQNLYLLKAHKHFFSITQQSPEKCANENNKPLLMNTQIILRPEYSAAAGSASARSASPAPTSPMQIDSPKVTTTKVIGCGVVDWFVMSGSGSSAGDQEV
jgi:hypothetical protein